MADLLKNIYNDSFFEKFIAAATSVAQNFDAENFLKTVKSEDWEGKALKERATHLAISLEKHLSGDYFEQVAQIFKMIPVLEKAGFKKQNLEFIFFPEFVQLFGSEKVAFSLDALEKITDFVSAEFAIRHFIVADTDLTLQKMTNWASHQNENVRRLASEGTRPRLPWGIGLKIFQKNPIPCLPILESLKNDDSEYVRRSVANHLNDISKDNPDLVKKIIADWKGQTKETDALLKHAARTMLKKGNVEVLGHFGISNVVLTQIEDFNLTPQELKIGESLNFSFNIRINSEKTEKLRLEFAVYYVKANGSLSKKIFQISENKFEANKTYTFTKSLSTKNLTTRKHYAGLHRLAIVVNGEEKVEANFMLFF